MKLTKKQKEWLVNNNKEWPIKCKMCDNHVKWIYCKGGGKFNIYCCRECAGADVGGINAKRKTTMVERYGVDNPQQSKEIKEKTKATNLERYGSENPFGSKKIKEKMKATMIDRHGVEYSQQSAEIRAKGKATNLERYGSDTPFGSDEIRDKIKATWLINHGVEHPWHSEEIRDKIKTTNMERYGSEIPSQTHMIDSLPLLQSTEWMIDQYIVQKKTLIQIGKELGVGDACVGRYAKSHNIDIRPNEIGSSISEQRWIEGMMESEGTYIQYEGNGGQYKIPGTNWSADGYCEATNTIYEFHGSVWHGNPRKYEPMEYPHSKIPKTADELYQKTKERERAIIELGYNLVVMWDDGVTYSHIV